jgi:hypothetical protein
MTNTNQPPREQFMDGPILRLGDQAIETIRRALTVSFFWNSCVALEGWASLVTPVSALIGLILGGVGAVKTDSLNLLLMGLAWVLAVGLLYYCAKRLLPACEMAVANGPTVISSRAFFDVLGLIMGMIAAGAFIFGIYMSIKTSTLMPLAAGSGTALLLAYFVTMALHPEIVTTSVDPNVSSGSDAIAIAMFLNKGFVRLSPIAMGVSVTLGALNGLKLLYALFKEEVGILDLFSGGAFPTQVLGGLFYPIGAYVLFVLAYLSVDVIMAVLRLHRIRVE